MGRGLLFVCPSGCRTQTVAERKEILMAVLSVFLSLVLMICFNLPPVLIGRHAFYSWTPNTAAPSTLPAPLTPPLIFSSKIGFFYAECGSQAQYHRFSNTVVFSPVPRSAIYIGSWLYNICMFLTCMCLPLNVSTLLILNGSSSSLKLFPQVFACGLKWTSIWVTRSLSSSTSCGIWRAQLTLSYWEDWM